MSVRFGVVWTRWILSLTGQLMDYVPEFQERRMRNFKILECGLGRLLLLVWIKEDFETEFLRYYEHTGTVLLKGSRSRTMETLGRNGLV